MTHRFVSDAELDSGAINAINTTQVVADRATIANATIGSATVTNANITNLTATVDYDPPFTGALTSGYTVQTKLAQYVSVKDFGAVGNGVADDTAAIQSAINAFKPYAQFVSSGAQIFFPRGRYRLTASLDLTDCHGCWLQGAGSRATELFSTGDFPVISSVGQPTSPLNAAAITDMTIRGGGSANTNAHGISLTWTVRCLVARLSMFSCRHALDLYHQWQLQVMNISVWGGGGDQSHTGVYLGPSTDAFIDNAICAFNVEVQSVSAYGFRIVNGQGSKIINCEAGAAGINGWFIGAPPSGTVKCTWVHFTNCLGDSCGNHNWLFDKGTAAELGEMQLSNCWSGNSGASGVFMNACSKITFGQFTAIGNATSAFVINQCTYITINGGNIQDNNESNTAIGDIAIQGGNWNVVNGCVINNQASNGGARSILESAATNLNIITSNVARKGITTIGGGTVAANNINS